MSSQRERDAELRLKVIAACVKDASPLWQASDSFLARMLLEFNGLYIVIYFDRSETSCLGVSSDGAVVDMEGYPMDGAEKEKARSVFLSAGMPDMVRKISAWRPGPY